MCSEFSQFAAHLLALGTDPTTGNLMYVTLSIKYAILFFIKADAARFISSSNSSHTLFWIQYLNCSTTFGGGQ